MIEGRPLRCAQANGGVGRRGQGRGGLVCDRQLSWVPDCRSCARLPCGESLGAPRKGAPPAPALTQLPPRSLLLWLLLLGAATPRDARTRPGWRRAGAPRLFGVVAAAAAPSPRCPCPSVGSSAQLAAHAAPSQIARCNSHGRCSLRGHAFHRRLEGGPQTLRRRHLRHGCCCFCCCLPADADGTAAAAAAANTAAGGVFACRGRERCDCGRAGCEMRCAPRAEARWNAPRVLLRLPRAPTCLRPSLLERKESLFSRPELKLPTGGCCGGTGWDVARLGRFTSHYLSVPCVSACGDRRRCALAVSCGRGGRRDGRATCVNSGVFRERGRGGGDYRPTPLSPSVAPRRPARDLQEGRVFKRPRQWPSVVNDQAAVGRVAYPPLERAAPPPPPPPRSHSVAIVHRVSAA
eukprot:365559-Chlamydomonas_euryale.AAC.3